MSTAVATTTTFSSTPRSSNVVNTNKWVTLVDVLGKGRGFVATKAIPFGTLILEDAHPVRADTLEELAECLLCEDGLKPLSTSLHHNAVHLPKDIVTQIPQRCRELGVSEADWVRALCQVKTNAWGCTGGTGKKLQLFQQLSFINHSCIPNACIAVDTGKVYSVTDITAGTEVCVSYTHARAYAPVILRKQLLKAIWHFDCTCERCNDPTSDHVIQGARFNIAAQPKMDQLAQMCCALMAKIGINSPSLSSVQPEEELSGDDLLEQYASEFTVLLRNQSKNCMFDLDHWAVHAARFEYLRQFDVFGEVIDPDIVSSANLEHIRTYFLELVAVHLRAQQKFLTPMHLLKHYTFVQMYSAAIDCLRIPLQQYMDVCVAADPEYRHTSLLWQLFGRLCPGCFKTSSRTTLLCTRCRNMHYCSTQCQRDDWPVHKMVCKKTSEPKSLSNAKVEHVTNMKNTINMKNVRNVHDENTDDSAFSASSSDSQKLKEVVLQLSSNNIIDSVNSSKEGDFGKTPWSLAAHQQRQELEMHDPPDRTEQEHEQVFSKLMAIEAELDDPTTGDGAECIKCGKVQFWRHMYSFQTSAADPTKFHSSLSLKNEIHGALMTEIDDVAAMISATATCIECIKKMRA